MRILGLQKLTLLDFPGRVACTIFTGGCNFRCPFCHNALLVLPDITPDALDSDEVITFLKKRVGLLDGVCVTGGEPTIQPDIAEFLSVLKGLGYAVKLDTNGSFPDRLRELIRDGLVDYVAMDIKSSPSGYAAAVGADSFDISPILESASFLMSGSVPFEFRTTVVRELHKRSDFEEIGRWLAGSEPYYLQAFVDSGELIRSGLSAYEKEEMIELAEAVRPYIPSVSLRGI